MVTDLRYNKNIIMTTTRWLPCSGAAKYYVTAILQLKEVIHYEHYSQSADRDICEREAQSFLKRLEERLYGNSLQDDEELNLQSNVHYRCMRGTSWKISLSILCPPDVEPLEFIREIDDTWAESEWAANLLFDIRQRDSWLDAGMYD